ncbi:hypothetical protein AtEden1_Chr1g0080621 [Arabidopsis thaliana]
MSGGSPIRRPVSSSSGRSPPKRFQFPRLRFNTISVHCLTFYLSAGGLPSKDPWQSCSKTFSSKVPSKKKVSNPQTADVADNQFVGNSMLVRVQGRYHPAATTGKMFNWQRRRSSSYSSSPRPHKLWLVADPFSAKEIKRCPCCVMC